MSRRVRYFIRRVAGGGGGGDGGSGDCDGGGGVEGVSVVCVGGGGGGGGGKRWQSVIRHDINIANDFQASRSEIADNNEPFIE